MSDTYLLDMAEIKASEKCPRFPYTHRYHECFAQARDSRGMPITVRSICPEIANLWYRLNINPVEREPYLYKEKP